MTIDKKKLFKYTRNIVFVLGAVFLTNGLFAVVMSKLGMAYFQMFPDTSEGSKDLLAGCVFAPITEEFIFRWMPITIAIIILGDERFKKIRWYFAGLISIAFAAVHYGYYSLFIQGCGGFFLSYLYYKNKGWGYASGVVAHSAWNFSLVWVLPTLSHIKPPSLFW